MLCKLLLFLIMQSLLEKTERVLRLRNYSLRTRKAYMLYIKKYISFLREREGEAKQRVVEDFFSTNITASSLHKQ